MSDYVQVYPETHEGDWMMCLHCGRAYRYGEHRALFTDYGDGDELCKLCPYPDCDVWAEEEGMVWSQMLEQNPQLPSVPERGVRYGARSEGE